MTKTPIEDMVIAARYAPCKIALGRLRDYIRILIAIPDLSDAHFILAFHSYMNGVTDRGECQLRSAKLSTRSIEIRDVFMKLQDDMRRDGYRQAAAIKGLVGK